MTKSKNIPSRRISSSSVKNICKFPSFKCGSTIICESLMEGHFCGLMEIDARVKFYCAQPFRVDYVHQGSEHHYTPDFFLRTLDRDIIVEVKPKQKAETEKWQSVFHKVTPILNTAGYKFIIVTEQDVYMQPRFHNLQILQRYWRERITYEVQAIVRSYFELKNHIISFGNAQRDLLQKGISPGTLYALIYWGVLSFDTWQPLNDASMIQLAGMRRRRDV